MSISIQARDQGGGGRGGGGVGGVGRPPQLPIPKILFHPLAILFHPWNVDGVTRAMSKGGGVLVNVQEGGGGVFFNFSEGGWRHADNVQGGGVPVQEWGRFSN